jgi:hypothetical protein
MPSEELIKAVAVTAELCGRTFTPAAAAVFVDDLATYPEVQVIGALRRCRREVRGILTVQDVVSRLDDGRPGAEEAWAMLPKDESGSVVWTHEMAEAAGVVWPMLSDGDQIAARMAFKEAYQRIVAKARDQGTPVQWMPSLGHDPNGRESALQEAVRHGRLTHEQAQAIVPRLEAPSKAMLALVSNIRADAAQMPADVRKSVQALRIQLSGGGRA